MTRPIGTAAELERRRRRAVELLDQGESPSTIARILGVHAGIPGELPGKGSITLRVRPEGPRGGHENDHLVTAAALRVFAIRSCAHRLCLGLGMVALGGPAWCRRGLAKSY